MTQRIHSHGKLLLTGEYVVLDGALSLAIPTQKGQSLDIVEIDEPKIHWQSFLHDKSLWINRELDLSLNEVFTKEDLVVERIQQILIEIQKLNPSLFKKGIQFKNELEFDRSWGLGSSSTLIYNLAQWAQIDPYVLLSNTFGGSGYDIACAQADGPITYQLKKSKPQVAKATFNPSFSEELFFVHLNKKQNSRESIQHYRNANPKNLDTAIGEISAITKACIGCKEIGHFEELLTAHENIISGLIKTPTIKKQMFPCYSRSIKRLGGWGVDFILAVGSVKEQEYFRKKGFTTIIPYAEMAL